MVAVTKTVALPAVVGVPDITPVLLFKVRPIGKLPSSVHVIGVSPVAARVWLYVAPSCPPGKLLVVMLGAVPTGGAAEITIVKVSL